MLNLFAQKESNNWCFADSVLLTFQGNTIKIGDVVISNNNGLDIEPSACISSSQGNLLFYVNATDGVSRSVSKIRNAKNEVITNGDSLRIDWSSTNGAIIIPKREKGLYYLFSLGISNDTFITKGSIYYLGIYYHEIDMNANNGNGKVVSKNNQLIIDRYVVERLASIKHNNGKDWWLIAHESKTDSFLVWLINDTGIHLQSRQAIGSVNKFETGTKPDGTSSWYWIDFAGEITINQDGNKLAYITMSGLLEAFDFNRCTGKFSNPKTLLHAKDHSPFVPYGCCLSPSGRFLYFSTKDTLFQTDLNNPDTATRTKVIYAHPSRIGNSFQQMELAPNNKIYINNFWKSNFLSVIHAPDSLGEECRFEYKGLDLGTKRTHGGLPNMPNYNLGAVLPIAHAGKEDSICRGQSVRLGTPPVRAGLRFSWSPTIGLDDPTSPQPLATPDSTITYRLTVTDTTLSAPCNIAVDDVRIEVLKARLSSDKDTLILPDDSTIQFYNDSQGAIRAEWDFDNGAFSADYFPQPVIYRKRSYYRVKLTAYGKNGCSDSAFKTVYVKGFPKGRNESVSPELKIYPNPFQSGFDIRFTLPEQEKITITVLNGLGLPVLQIVKDQSYPAGTHELSVDGSTLSAGVYCCKVAVGNKIVQTFNLIKTQ